MRYRSIRIEPREVSASASGNKVRKPNVRYWHLADNPTAPAFVRFWTKADKVQILAALCLSANDPKRTLAEVFLVAKSQVGLAT